jgi:hypothetical protein
LGPRGTAWDTLGTLLGVGTDSLYYRGLSNEIAASEPCDVKSNPSRMGLKVERYRLDGWSINRHYFAPQALIRSVGGSSWNRTSDLSIIREVSRISLRPDVSHRVPISLVKGVTRSQS